MQTGSEASTLRISEAAIVNCPLHGHGTPSGFRHFLGTPRASQRFKAYGLDPLDAPEHLPKIRGLMNRLSRRMSAEVDWLPHAEPKLERWENPLIPSGYTYLLQFVAHDLVHSAMPLSVAGSLSDDTANARRSALKLETLFGSGPVGSPFVYAMDAPNDERRTKLRLGRMRWKDKAVESGCPFRDIARTPAENVTGIDRSVVGHRVALTEALVVDPRNDDHAIMSQLTALFALLHNGLIDMVRDGEPATGANANLGAAYRRFLCARDALTAIYRNIIRKDVMRRVLHPAIYAAYSSPDPDFMDRAAPSESDSAARGPRERNGWQVPLEFSHGAFRFGHAMVRPEYVINDLSTHDLINTLEKNSANDPVNMPLDATWIVRWSRFFEIQGSTPNFSRRIGPYLSEGLGSDQIFPAIDQTNRVGLLYRDLLGSTLAGMWSVDALIGEIAVRRPHFIGASRLLADRRYRVNQLREWLSCEPAYGRLTPEDIETLANDPPLPFFILFEAMRQPAAGLCLGPLGSIIVSEVIFGALADDEDPIGSVAGSLTDTLADISAEYYPTNVFENVAEIERMDQLVEFVAEIGDLRQAVPAFL